MQDSGALKNLSETCDRLIGYLSNRREYYFMIMKKTVAVLLVALLILSFTACGSGQTTSTVSLVLPGEESSVESSGLAESSEVPVTNANEVEDNLDGLSEYLKGNFAVAGEKETMSFDVIGAVNGYKYAFTYNSKNVQVEIYEFDLDNPNAEGKACLESVKANGTFTVLEKEVSAVISDSGKYIMIYTDNDGDEKNVAQKERVQELFKDFKAL